MPHSKDSFVELCSSDYGIFLAALDSQIFTSLFTVGGVVLGAWLTH